MRWTALNGIGAVFWITGLFLALGVTHAGSAAAWFPANSTDLGAAFGIVGLVILLWANLADA